MGETLVKVLQINSVCGIGSTGRIATDIHAILKEQGHESYIAYGRNNPMNCETAIRIGNKLDNYAHVAKTRILDEHGFGSKKATREFITKIKELDPDVIHLHNIHGYYINVEILFDYLKEANKPVVWTLHDCWAFTGHCANFDFVGCECWKIEGHHKCLQPGSYPASWLINNSKRNFEKKKRIFTEVKNLTIVTPSKWLAGLVKESFLSEYPVEVINNGIDLDVFQPTTNNFKRSYNIDEKFIILGVANIWNERKGLNYFKKLAKRLRNDEVIVLVGLTSRQIKYLPSNIIGIIRTDSVKSLADIYSSADIFVNPTLEEVMGLTNVEALACGTPVITFDTGGSVECVDNNSGYIVAKGGLNQLSKAIQKVKQRGKLYYSEYCIERANVLYDKVDKFNEYIDRYKMNLFI
jgi:glycosyltransferase involved in cell wall biosynthesis